MANTDYGAIPLTLAEGVSEMLNKKLSVTTGFKPSEWADNINLLGKLPVKTASGSIAHFDDGADDVPLASYKFGITAVQSGSGTPSPSNVRPISGWNKVSGQGTGANIWDEVYPTLYSSVSYIPIKVGNGITVTLSSDCPLNTSNATNLFLLAGKVTSGASTATNGVSINNPKTQTAVDGYVTIGARNAGQVDPRTYHTQLEYGSTATAYSPYTATPFEIPLGDTIYGGWVDEQGNGEVTYGKVDLSTLTWVYQSSYSRFNCTDMQGVIKAPANNSTVITGALCSLFGIDASDNTASSSFDNIIGVSSTGNIQIRDTSLNGDLDALGTLLQGSAFVYPLATPIPFTLSDMPVLNSRLGTNNFWVDSGDSEVQYRADIDLALAQ